jgi:hypothetical protein
MKLASNVAIKQPSNQATKQGSRSMMAINCLHQLGHLAIQVPTETVMGQTLL